MEFITFKALVTKEVREERTVNLYKIENDMDSIFEYYESSEDAETREKQLELQKNGHHFKLDDGSYFTCHIHNKEEMKNLFFNYQEKEYYTKNKLSRWILKNEEIKCSFPSVLTFRILRSSSWDFDLNFWIENTDDMITEAEKELDKLLITISKLKGE